MRPTNFLLPCGIVCVLAGLTGCHGMYRQPPPETALLAGIPPEELRDVLAGMARSHDQKVELAFYVSLPWQGVDEPFKAFYPQMRSQQADLAKELRAWAAAHDLDMSFHFSDDTDGRAVKIMEARQEKVLRADNRTDFSRDALVQMYADYEFQISLVQALLPRVHDAGLKAYLEKSLQVHTQGSAEITGLLKKFKLS